MDLVQEQYRLEGLMSSEGAERFCQKIQEAQQKETLSSTQLGKFVVGKSLGELSRRIKELLATTNEPGKGHKQLALVKDMNPDALAFLTLRKLINSITMQPLLTSVSLTLADMIEAEARADHFELHAPDRFEKAMVRVSKAVGEIRKRNSLTVIMNRVKDGAAYGKASVPELEFKRWPSSEKMVLGTVLITEAMAITGLAEVKHRRKGVKVEKVLVATETFLHWLANNTERIAVLSPYRWPCVIPPKEYSTVDDGGYYTLPPIKGNRFLKTGNKDFLNALREIDLSEVYTTINAAQNTPWRVNRKVLQVLKTMWDNNTPLGILPSQEPKEMPRCPSCGLVVGHDHPCFEDADVLQEWKMRARNTHLDNTRVSSRRLRVLRVLWLAETYENYGRIYFPYQIDYRGRLYAIPEYMNPQADDMGKALLEFAEGKRIETKEAREWLMIHIANTYGNDKVSYQDRVRWVEENSDEIVRCASDPLTYRLWSDADSPWCFLAACFEWAAYLENPEEFVSHIPVAQDGTCSGLQHYSAMLRDPVGGAAVNLIPAEKPQDIYAVVAKKAQIKLNSFTAADEDYHLAQEWLKSGLLNRKLTKRSVMTLPYGSTAHSSISFVRDYIEEVREKNPYAVPWDAKDTHKAACFMSKIVWSCIEETVVAASNAMKWLKKLGTYVVDHNLPIAWTTPTGMIVLQRYVSYAARRVTTHLYGNAFKSFSEAGKDIEVDTKTARVWLKFSEPTDTLDRRRHISGFAPNFVHSLDATALVRAVNAASSKHGINAFALIHDSFGTHAADSATLARTLREEFVRMYEENDVLQDLYDEVAAYVGSADDLPPPPPERGSLDLRSVLESPYFFA